MRLWWAAAGTAGDAAAQEVALLGVDEADAGEGFCGPTFETSAAGVMKTDTPIAETPRSVSVVTQQQIQDPGALVHPGARVFAGNGGNDNRGDWLTVRGFEPTIFPDGMQSFFGYYDNVRPEPFLPSQSRC